MISELESKMIPKGRIDLIGLGRLGIRTGLNLIEVHRGGPSQIAVFDGQKISGSDIIFTLLGAKNEEYKTDFFKKLCTHDKSYREVISIPEYVNEDNLDLVKGDVVVIEIAGGNTIPTTANIIKHVRSYGGKTISTAGIFGVGDEKIEIKDISFEKTEKSGQESVIKIVGQYRDEINKNKIISSLMAMQGVSKVLEIE